MELRKNLEKVHRILDEAKIGHALIGGFALAVYGIQRSTMDIDFLAVGSEKDRIKFLLSQNGYNLRFESSEVLQFGGEGFVDILLANRPTSLEMIKKARTNVELGLYVLRPEDIIGLKIQAYKNDPSRELQDKADIQNLLKLSELNIQDIKQYAELFGEWENIQTLKPK